MKKLFGAWLLLLFTPLAWAISPYYYGTRVNSGGDLNKAMSEVETRLGQAGFKVIGRHTPVGLPEYGVVVATDDAMLATLQRLGGAAIVGATVRVGVKSDGTVSWTNPEYWYRAYLRKGFKSAEKSVKALRGKLSKALGLKAPFGGDVDVEDLRDYQYMFGMEGFDSDKNLLIEHLSFDDAVASIRSNLERHVDGTAKVYEVVIPEKQMAVFGVAFNDPKTGEGWWVKAIGAENIAALPYEIYVTGGAVNHLYARFRIALGWPAVGMGSFMRIVEAPYKIQESLAKVSNTAPDLK